MPKHYFDFYTLPIAFFLDEGALKRSFYANSKKYHPDFHTLESEEKQLELLELSTLNTQAYKTLSHFDTRMKYILDLKGALAEEGKNTLPQTFLMEMMEINEALMELEFDFDAKIFFTVQKDIQNTENELLSDIKPLLEGYKEGTETPEILEKIKNFYLKRRYLLRISENLLKFAPQ